MTKAADITLSLNRPVEDAGWNWAEAATEQWTAAAQKEGLDVEVISYEVPDTDHDAAIVSVDGAPYLVSVHNDEITAKHEGP